MTPKLRRLFAVALTSICMGAAAPLAAQAPATALPAGITQVTSVEGITEYRLANGLQVLLVPDASKPSTTVNLTYRVGSRHENYGETGMAHLLEHLVFKGTPTHKNVWAEFTRRGLRANGTTSTDRTNYFASFTANDDSLRWYLGWLADSMVNSFIAREDLDSEMTVVRNEMEMGENNPGRILVQRTLATMFDWHNYGKSTIGARADVENVDIARLQAFYRLHYQPDNATLIVAGRFDAAQVLARVAESFGPIPRPTRVLPSNHTLEPAQDGERQVTVRRVGAAPFVFMAHHVPPGSHPDHPAIELLTQVLADTPGGRLHKRLVDKQLAAGAFGFTFAFAEPSAKLVGVQLAPDQDVDKARAEMAAVLDGLKSEPVTADELERARTKWLNEWEQGFADPEVVGVALSSAIALGDWRLYFLTRDRIRKVTLADVQRVAAERLKPDNRTVALYRPVPQPDRAPAPARVDVAAAVKDYKGDPNVAQAEAFEATPANLDRRSQRFELASGMKVALLPKGTRGRAVQLRIALHYGDEKSLFGQDTVAAFVAQMIDKGGAGQTRQQIADRFDQLRTLFSVSQSGQLIIVNVETVREHLPAVIEQVGRLLRNPAFPAEPLEEVRRQWLAGLAESRREPESMVANAIERQGNPYPRGDLRYASTFDEEEADVKAVTVDQLKAFHRRFYSAARAEFSAVGDMDAAAVKAAAERAFGDWKAPAAGPLPYVRIARPLLPPKPERLLLQAPDKQNASMQAKLPLPLNDSHPDFAAFLLANHIFGAGGNSRLWQRIRETDGLSYDVRSNVQWSQHDLNSRWQSSAIFAPQNLPRVEKAWQEEAARSLKDGFTQAEVDEARTSQLNFRRLNRAQDGTVAFSALLGLHLGRTFAFSQAVDERIAATTLEQVNAAWRKYFDPAKVVFAWGGDFAKAQVK
jgi:zinc protease